jgi:hypothetical protein
MKGCDEMFVINNSLKQYKTIIGGKNEFKKVRLA